ncbi:MAG: hypothetical protein CL955_05975 [Erythrobacteraceae bacterium]|jgi:hypothetical protein|nr:hypothetical protein [Erythrobacteraceae bacterium]
MSDIVEGLGGAVEGGLAGRAVEPKHGEAGHGDAHGGPCLNCGAQPLGSYCQNCGQQVHVHRTLSAIGHDLLHGVLHLDGKLWATLPLLVFKPGKLTRRYIDGERAKFVSPMAMFLFSVFAMFAVFQMVGLTVPTDLSRVNPDEFANVIDEQAERVDREIEELDAELDSPGLTAADRARFEAQRKELLDQKEGLTAAGDLPFVEAEDSPPGEAAADEQPDTAESEDVTATVSGFDLGDTAFIKKWREQPELMLYKLQTNGYKFSWLLIPLSIPFVWLTFLWRRRFRAYDHAIFVTYSLSFVTLLFIAVSVLSAIGAHEAILFFSMVLIPPIHLYKQLRGAYEIGRFSAFWRLMFLSMCIWIVLLLFLQILLALGAF